MEPPLPHSQLASLHMCFISIAPHVIPRLAHICRSVVGRRRFSIAMQQQRFPPRRPTEAYAVPFLLDRSRSPNFLLLNVSDEDLYGLTFRLSGPGIVAPLGPLELRAGNVIRFSVRGDEPARSSVLIVRWFRPNGDEYLWRISF